MGERVAVQIIILQMAEVEKRTIRIKREKPGSNRLTEEREHDADG